jgi:antitoxin HicB
MKQHKHIGSSFDDFLQEDGILHEVNALAIKTIIARHLQEYMQEEGITQTDMAKRLGTSRAGLSRILDENNSSMTLLTLNKAAAVLGKKIEIQLLPISQNK